MSQAPDQYFAFLSYSHRDERWAKWLHRALETYRVPKDLIGLPSSDGTALPGRMTPIFRDRDELPTGTDLGVLVTRALERSRYLLVVCSPMAAQSRWVNEEIVQFARQGKGDRVLALIVDGEPNAADIGGGARECFPPALRYELDAGGGLTDRRREPLAADARADKDGKYNAKLKLAASILGVGFDRLRQRDVRRRRRRLISMSAGGLAIAMIIGALARSALISRGSAEREATNARRAATLAQRSERDANRSAAATLRDEAQRELSDRPIKATLLLGKAYSLDPADTSIRTLLPRALDVVLATTLVHNGVVHRAAFSGNGAYIVTACADDTAKLWSAETGNLIAVLIGHKGAVRSAAFNKQGTRIVTASDDGTAKIWDGKSGSIIRTLEGHRGTVYSAEFSDNGARVATASLDATAKLWEADTGNLVGTLNGHKGAVYSALFSNDGTRIVTASEDKTAKLWNGESGALIRTFRGHDQDVTWAGFNNDGTRIVTTTLGKTSQLWDAKTGRHIHDLADKCVSGAFSADGAQFLTTGEHFVGVHEEPNLLMWDSKTLRATTLIGHKSAVNSAAFSNDGAHIVSAGDDATARIWSIHGGELVTTLQGHTAAVVSAAFSADGKRVVTASSDGTVKVWNGNFGLLGTLSGHQEGLVCATFSNDGSYIATASVDGTARLWDGKTGDQITTFRGHTSSILFATFSGDGTRLVTASTDNTAKLWDIKSRQPVRTLVGHQGSVFSAVFTKDGKRVATASWDGKVKIWDSKTGNPVITLEQSDPSPCFSVSFSDDAARVLARCGVRAVLWEARSGKVISTLEGEAPMDVAVFAHNGSRIVTASRYDKVRLWDGTAGAFVRTIGDSDATWVAFSHDDAHIITVNVDGTVDLRDTELGRLSATLRGLERETRLAVFSNDDTRVVTAGNDGHVQLWDANSGNLIITLEGHRGAVASAVFSNDGTRVVTASVDRTARLWNVALETRSPETIARLIADHVPWRLEGGVVVSRDAPRSLITYPSRPLVTVPGFARVPWQP
jgi:WD40 repeat protein